MYIHTHVLMVQREADQQIHGRRLPSASPRDGPRWRTSRLPTSISLQSTPDHRYETSGQLGLTYMGISQRHDDTALGPAEKCSSANTGPFVASNTSPSPPIYTLAWRCTWSTGPWGSAWSTRARAWRGRTARRPRGWPFGFPSARDAGLPTRQ